MLHTRIHSTAPHSADRASEWFPLLPRHKPACRALAERIGELRDLTQTTAGATTYRHIAQAAEAHNKAALIASDCGLPTLAHRLCWRQFTLFQRSAPLAGDTARLALQPLINLARLAIRAGDGMRAHHILRQIHSGVTSQNTRTIDNRTVDFHTFLRDPADLPEIHRFLWTVLLADGTRALTRAGRWNEVKQHLERHKGIGSRMLDGRQVAILCRATSGAHEAALALIDSSTTSEAWERAVAACLRTLCLHKANRESNQAAVAMVDTYLDLPADTPIAFHTRLGLCVLDLTDTRTQRRADIASRVLRRVLAYGDADSAAHLLDHPACETATDQTERAALASIIARSGLRQGWIAEDLAKDLFSAVTTSEENLARGLQQQAHER
ncbi:hypothetical protein [Salinactinospora qingdaonensis]|uniref:Uncharacterized protein n=1 Tax=Salinactinospora qingdaonensis TaxID=702744 RepID=A0ABP7GED4_9ACTN